MCNSCLIHFICNAKDASLFEMELEMAIRSSLLHQVFSKSLSLRDSFCNQELINLK